MAETSSDGVVEQFDNARVEQSGPTAYYIPNETGEVDLHNSDGQALSQHPGVVSFTREGDSKRDPSRRAIYWALLQERVGDESEKHPLLYDTQVTEAESPEDLQIPWIVALTTNKAVYAAYLAAHGKSNSFIADALTVSVSTVSQYLSDFKSERR